MGLLGPSHIHALGGTKEKRRVGRGTGEKCLTGSKQNVSYPTIRKVNLNLS